MRSLSLNPMMLRSKFLKAMDVIHFAEFRVKPENQQRLIELEEENVGIALKHPDLISANFHRSLDGTSIVN
jgi:Antibiotic biosynthesis monooxygenase